MDRPALSNQLEITMDMVSVGVAAYAEFDPEIDEPEALVFAILYRAALLSRCGDNLLKFNDAG